MSKRGCNRNPTLPLSTIRTPLLIIVLFALSVGCTTRHQLSGATYKDPITITLSSIQVTNGHSFCVFEMKNVGDREMWFSGDNDEHPDYICQKKPETLSGWIGPTDVSGEFCGWGFGRWRIMPGESKRFRYRFEASSSPTKAFRIGVPFGELENPPSSLPDLIYWSDTVQPAATSEMQKDRIHPTEQ